MRTFLGLWLLFFFSCSSLLSQDLGEDYTSEWKKFYPSKALKSGMRTSVFNYGNHSGATINKFYGIFKNTNTN